MSKPQIRPGHKPGVETPSPRLSLLLEFNADGLASAVEGGVPSKSLLRSLVADMREFSRQAWLLEHQAAQGGGRP